MKFLEEMQWRGLIHTISDYEKLDKILESGIKVYLGIDPTADSMHIGHLLPVVMLRRFQMAGHTPVPLMGAGTGRIGDPSGRSNERVLLDIEVIRDNAEKIKAQVTNIMDLNAKNKPLFLNNDDWGAKITMFEFLRDYGKYFTINYMLAKDSIASRLESGLSFTEFSYTIIQALDWLIMNEEHGVNMQIGGADQWGNITSGLDLIRKKRPEETCVGWTIPLLTKADGTKFGKTASGAIWLDPKRTSPYEFYQFFLNSADADVIKYLKVFTFLNKEEIEALEESLKNEPEKRLAQKALAKEVTIMVHSEEAYNRAVEISNALFSGDIKSLNYDEIKDSFRDVPSVEVNDNEINIVDFLSDTKICSSKREAREFVNTNAIRINGYVINSLDYLVKKEDAFNNELSIVRRGKKNYFKVIFN